MRRPLHRSHNQHGPFFWRPSAPVSSTTMVDVCGTAVFETDCETDRCARSDAQDHRRAGGRRGSCHVRRACHRHHCTFHGFALVEFWLHEDELVVRLRQTWRSGRVFEGSDVAGDPRLRGIQIPAIAMSEGTVFGRRSPLLLENFAHDPVQKAVCDPLGFDLASFAAERGVSTYLNVPLQFGKRSLGAILVYLPAERAIHRVQDPSCHGPGSAGQPCDSFDRFG